MPKGSHPRFFQRQRVQRAAVSFVLLLAAWRSGLFAQALAPTPTPLATMLDELRSGPRENPAREDKLRELFLAAGAKPDDVLMMPVIVNGQVAGRNVVVTKRGTTPTALVIGAHVDKVSVGDGVIDNWSGCVLIKNLYQALRAVPTKHTLIFAAFALEERGLIGSRQYVELLQRDKAPTVVAMANFDCVGVGGPFLWANGSNQRMKELAHRVAAEKKLELTDHLISGVSADNLSFERVGIPSLTIDGLPIDQLRLIHSERDTFDALVPDRYEAAYKLALELVLAMDRAF